MGGFTTRLISLLRLIFDFPAFRYSLRYSDAFSMLQEAFVLAPGERMMKMAVGFVVGNNIRGDYLEFGVSGGQGITSVFHFAQRYNLKSMRFYGFDSFQGLPEITGVDANGYCPFSKGQYACDVNTFKKGISRNGVDINRVAIIPGWFGEVLNEETKKTLPIRKAAIIVVDCDLYESSIPVLNFITDYVQDGTVLIFDDWFAFRGNPNRGEQRAFREWLRNNPDIKATEFHKYGHGGNSFILHRN